MSWAQNAEPIPNVNVTAPAAEPDNDIERLFPPPSKQLGDGSVAAGYRVDSVKDVGPFKNMKLQDTPYTINVISSDFIENTQSFATPGSFLEKMPGGLQYSYTDQRPVTGTPLFRGLGNTGQQRVDGLPVPTTSGLLFLEPFDRVEALSSVSGFMYGVGNTTGQLNYVLKRPTRAPFFADVTTGVLIGTSPYAHVDVGGRLADGSGGYRFNLVAQDGDTLVSGQNLTKYAFSGALDYQPSESVLLQVDGFVGRWNGILPAIWIPGTDNVKYSTTPVPDPSKLWSQPWSYADTRTTMLGTKLTLDITDWMTTRTAFRYTDTLYASDYMNNFINENWTYDQMIFSLRNYDRWNVAGYQYVDFKFDTLGVEHTFTAGIVANHYEENSAQDNIAVTYDTPWIGLPMFVPSFRPNPSPVIGKLPRYTPTEVTTTNWSIGDRIEISKYWSALLGVSFSHIEQVNRRTDSTVTSDYIADKATPTFALLFRPVSFVTIYGSYVQGLQQGLVVNGAQYTNNGTTLPPYLREQYEVGVKATIGNVLYSLAFYQIESALQYRLNNGDGTFTYMQNGLQRNKGIDFSATGEVLPGFRFLGGVSFVDARVAKNDSDTRTVGKRASTAANWLLKASLEYDLPFVQGLTLTGGAYYTSAFYDDIYNTDRIPGHTTYDAGLRYTTSIEGTPVIARFNVSNLANSAYWVAGGVVSDPRRFAGSIQVKF